MNDRLQQALDGDLDTARLSRAEQTAVAETEALITAVCMAIPAGTPPNLAPEIQTRIAAAGSRRPRGREWGHRTVAGWLWRPHRVALVWRPAYAVVAIGFLATLLIWPPETADLDNPIARPGVMALAGPTDRVLVQFRLEAPRAEHVSLAGDFTGWQPAYPLARSEPGVWTVVVPLEAGLHDYAFVIDDERWVPDPTAPAVADGFGGLNSRIAVLVPDTGRSL